MKYLRLNFKANMRKSFFTQSIINWYNSLPQDVVEPDILTRFQRRRTKAQITSPSAGIKHSRGITSKYIFLGL